MKKTNYWKMQKRGIKKSAAVACISHATKNDLCKIVPQLSSRCRVVYMPVSSDMYVPVTFKRDPFFLALGGAVNKNLERMISAFEIARTSIPDYELVVCGHVDKNEEIKRALPEGVRFESMDNYHHLLARCSGLLFCSTHEGLGIPPVEAMECGCPLIVSNIPPVHETCGDAAYYANPYDCVSIAEGMKTVAENPKKWAEMSSRGLRRYREKSGAAGKEWLNIYQSIIEKKREYTRSC
ncbi:MAG: glycosyltransferase [Chitinivibrionales bacterium]|nr:glycosyltransferase [Chitinivibrionales bacterium]